MKEQVGGSEKAEICMTSFMNDSLHMHLTLFSFFADGYPFLSLTKNNAYNVGFNSTQAGIVSLLGNAALALGGKSTRVQ